MKIPTTWRYFPNFDVGLLWNNIQTITLEAPKISINLIQIPKSSEARSRAAANALRNMSVIVYGVGVGEADRDQMIEVIGNGNEEDVIMTESFKDFMNTKYEEFNQKVCDEASNGMVHGLGF